MNKPNPIVVYVVVGALAFSLATYALTLALCALRGATPPDNVLGCFKDLGIFASGALASLLAKTGSVPEEPTQTEITNTPEHPVPTQPQQSAGETPATTPTQATI